MATMVAPRIGTLALARIQAVVVGAIAMAPVMDASAAEPRQILAAVQRQAEAVAQAPAAQRFDLARDLLRTMQRTPICRGCEAAATRGLTADQTVQLKALARAIKQGTDVGPAQERTWTSLIAKTGKGAKIDLNAMLAYLVSGAYAVQTGRWKRLVDGEAARRAEQDRVRQQTEERDRTAREAPSVSTGAEAKRAAEKIDQTLRNSGRATELGLQDLRDSAEELSALMLLFGDILKSWHDRAKALLENLNAERNLIGDSLIALGGSLDRDPPVAGESAHTGSKTGTSPRFAPPSTPTSGVA
jgi:hypothetical protein